MWATTARAAFSYFPISIAITTIPRSPLSNTSGTLFIIEKTIWVFLEFQFYGADSPFRSLLPISLLKSLQTHIHQNHGWKQSEGSREKPANEGNVVVVHTDMGILLFDQQTGSRGYFWNSNNRLYFENPSPSEPAVCFPFDCLRLAMSQFRTI